jgi:hypothetical protein
LSRKQNLFLSVIVSILLLGALVQMLRVLELIPFSVQDEYQEAVVQTASSEAEAPPPAGQKLHILFYTHEEDRVGEAVKRNAAAALELAKLPWDELGGDDIRELEPNPWTVLVLTGENINELDYAVVQSYVERGGRLAVLTRFHAPQWHELLGIAESTGFRPGVVRGIQIMKPLFPGYPNLSASSKMFSNSMLDVKLKPQAEAYLLSEQLPLLWTYPYGKGKVVVWNQSAGSQKPSRGLLLHSLGLAADSLVTAQVGIRTLDIDDFPSPPPPGTNPLIAQEYGLATLDFYERIWWADMARFAERYGWKYTGLMIGNYQNRTEPPFASLTEGDMQVTQYFGTKLLRIGGELGLHGYNHQSLVTKEEPILAALRYVPWPNRDAMEQGLTKLADLARHNFPKHNLRTYVPPSNVMGLQGKEALVRAVPSVNTIAALYFTAGEPGFLEQEFGPDPDFPQLYAYPRITSGYQLSEEDRFFEADVIANFGLVHHFVHPDDVIDVQRSGGKGWGNLSGAFENWMSSLVSRYPYLTPLTVRDGVKKLVTYQNAQVDTYYEADRITIRTKEQIVPMHYMLRLPAGKQPSVNSEEGTVVPMGEGLWRLDAVKPTVQIQIKDVTS